MSTPRVIETLLPLARVERDDFADEPARKVEPYHHPSQREAVRASLNAVLHTHAYDRETGR